MIKKKHILPFLLLVSAACSAQDSYKDSMQVFIKDYIDKHEVVTGNDKKSLNFFPVNKDYRVIANFERVKNGGWFTMETSGTTKKHFVCMALFILPFMIQRLN